MDKLVPPQTWELAKKFHDKVLENNPDEPSAFLAAVSMLIAAAPTSEILADVIQKVFSEVIIPTAPGASCHIIEVSTRLSYRFTANRALLDTRRPMLDLEDDQAGLIFQTASHLTSDTTLGLSSYLDCMGSSLSPYVWAFTVGRPGAVVLFVFGKALTGQYDLPRDVIQLLAPSMHLKQERGSDNRPQIESKVYEQAANWWVRQLDILFSVATEPANYVHEGAYDPMMAVQKLLTLEQTFRDCQSIATNTRDQHAKISLAFQALTRMEGLVSHWNLNKMLSLTEAQELLEAVKKEIPEQIHTVYLPRAEKALAALQFIQKGFFLADRHGEENVTLPRKNGDDESVPRAKASKEWLLLYRNSLHGFDQKSTARQAALLAAHNGQIPGEIADLAWLHLLAIMANPKLLIRFKISSSDT
ncbi:hypothetical protein [Arthrobacter alpinus]|nr:hypothetical protein [Arthrobacter alpinus]